MTSTVRLVTYNFLVGGSARRGGHWSRLLRSLRPDVVFGQECRPPEASFDERFRPEAGDAFVWCPAGRSRWGSGLWLRSASFTRIEVPQFDGWVVGGALEKTPWTTRPTCLFSVHVPAGERGYVRSLHEILDRIGRIRCGRELVLGGDFNVTVGYRPAEHARASVRRRHDLLDRLAHELDVVSSWQAAHPTRRLAQTLRWTANPATPYHCDGLLVPRAWARSITSCRVVQGSRWRQLSDHNPVFAEIDL